MSISFNTFSQMAQSVGKDSQTIAQSGGKLQKGSAFGFFKFSAKKAENLETSKAFVASIKSHPVFKSYLPAVADVTRELETSTKPLTARTVKAVEKALTTAVDAQKMKNADTAMKLETETGLNPTVLEGIREFCDKSGIDMAGMAPKKAFEAVKGTVVEKFTEAMPNVGNEVKAGLKQAPFIMDAMKELLPPDCDRLDKVPRNLMGDVIRKLEPRLAIMSHMGDACYSLNNEDVQKATNFLVENRERELVPNARIKETLADMANQVMEGRADLSTTRGCEKALISVMAKAPAASTMETVLTESGFSPETAKALATPLAHHPKVTPALNEALNGLDFTSTSLKDDIKTTFGHVMHSFIAENKAELQHIVSQFAEQGIPEKAQKAMVNAVLGGADFVGMTFVADGVMKPEAFAKGLEAFNECINSCTHGVRGEFGKDDKQDIIAGVMDYYLKQSGVAKSDAYKNMHDQFASVSRNLSLISNSVRNFNYDSMLQLKLMSQCSILSAMGLALQPYPKGSDEANTVVIFDGKTQDQITEDYAGEKYTTNEKGRQITVPLVEAGNKQLEPLTIAVGKNAGMSPELFGIQANHDMKVLHALADPLLGLADDTLSGAPNAQLTAMITGLKADCGLGDRGGLTVDVAKINVKGLREAVYAAYAELAENGDMVTEEAFAKVINNTISRELTKMGEAMNTIAQSASMADGDKQTMVDMVLATSIRTAPALDAVYSASLGRLPKENKALVDSGAKSLENPLALDATVPAFIQGDFGTSLRSLHTASAGATHGDMALNQLAQGFAHAVANTPRLSDAQRQGLSQALNADYSKNLGILFSAVNNGIDGMLDRAGTFPQAAEMRLLTKKATNTATLAGLATLRDHLDARLAKDAGLPMPQAQPHFYHDNASEIPCHLFSRAVLNEVTSGLYQEGRQLVSKMDILISNKEPAPNATTFRVANSVMNRMQNAPYEGSIIERMVSGSADKLVAASQNGTKELTPRQIYSILTGKRAPLRLKEADMATKIHNVTVEAYRKMGASLSPMTAQNEPYFMAFVGVAQTQGISPNAMASVLKGKRLSIDSVAGEALTMSGLASHTENNAYGLVTDYRRKGPETSVSFTNFHGAVTNFGAHPEISDEDNVPANPIFQDIMATAGAMAQTPRQKAVILQSISQSSTVLFRMMGGAFAQHIYEHGNFAYDFTQNGDGSVDARITLPPTNGFDGSLTFNIDINGHAKATSFDFGLAR